jgi:hypothetical protein
MERVKSWVKRISSRFLVVVAFAAAACACAPEAPLEDLLSVDASAPTFLGCAATGADRVEFRFSEPVAVSSLRFDHAPQGTISVDGSTVVVTFPSALEEGGRYVADILVEDPEGNSLSVLTPFRGRNNRMPRLRITELRTEYAKPKVEFIELHLESAGQLGGMRLVSSAQGFASTLFEFPRAEAASGEYVVVHLRKIEDGCIDEAGGLAVSAGTDSSPTARDFWVDGSEKKVRKTDALALLDQDGGVLDALLVSEMEEGEWKSEELIASAAYLQDRGAWKTAGGGSGGLLPASAASSLGTTATRTICRSEPDADTDTSADWYVTATSCATPGRANNPKRYVPTASKK